MIKKISHFAVFMVAWLLQCFAVDSLVNTYKWIDTPMVMAIGTIAMFVAMIVADKVVRK